MNIEEIKSLIHIMGESGLTCIEITEGDNKVRLEKKPAAITEVRAISPVSNESVTPAQAPATSTDKPVDFNNMKEIKSPMVGMYYCAPSPEAEPYVKIGSKVKKGDVLCVIEAMKLLNEITADADGEILDICAENGQVVEYGQTLFKIC